MVKAITIGRGNYRRIRSALGLELELGRPKLGPSFSVEPPCVISAAVDSRTNVTVGAFTYISPTDGIGRFIHNCDIGRYCSIAAGVWVAPGIILPPGCRLPLCSMIIRPLPGVSKSWGERQLRLAHGSLQSE